MINAKILDQFVTSVTRALPEGPKGIEKNVRAALQGALDRMKLVSREELDVQEQVLMRTRMRLEELERRITELEAQLNKK